MWGRSGLVSYWNPWGKLTIIGIWWVKFVVSLYLGKNVWVISMCESKLSMLSAFWRLNFFRVLHFCVFVRGGPLHPRGGVKWPPVGWNDPGHFTPFPQIWGEMARVTSPHTPRVTSPHTIKIFSTRPQADFIIAWDHQLEQLNRQLKIRSIKIVYHILPYIITLMLHCLWISNITIFLQKNDKCVVLTFLCVCLLQYHTTKDF